MSDPYFEIIASMPCMVCQVLPVQVHHCLGGSMAGRKGMGIKTSDELCIPLCMHHHTGGEGIHTIGVLTWEARYGSQESMLAAVSRKMEMRLGFVPSPKPNRVRRSSKILPRRA